MVGVFLAPCAGTLNYSEEAVAANAAEREFVRRRAWGWRVFEEVFGISEKIFLNFLQKNVTFRHFNVLWFGVFAPYGFRLCTTITDTQRDRGLGLN